MRVVRRRRRTTIGDVARRAGVSNGAVSLALNGRSGVGEGTRQRIRVAAEELGWRPNIGARSLLSSRAFAVGLILSRQPELLGADPFFPSFIAGVESEIAPRGYSLVLQVVPDDPKTVADAYRRMAQESRVDGVFLTDLRLRDMRLLLVRELDLPAIAVGRPAERTSVPAVMIDDHLGVREAVAHLLALGHRRIAFVQGPAEYVHSASRAATWRAALRRARVPDGPLETADFSGPGGAAAMSRLLESPERPTAVVFANDIMAIAGMSVAAQAGVAVPRDLSVVGFDDVPLAAHVNPPLTTVRQEVSLWGRAAAAALLSTVEDRQPSIAALPSSQLIVRASTAPVPESNAGREGIWTIG